MDAGHLHPVLRGMPSDWPLVRIDDVFSIQQGKQVSARHRNGDRPRAFLRTRNVYWGRLDLAELDTMHFSEEEERRLRLVPGDLLTCEGGWVGRSAIWNGEASGCLYQNHLHRLRRLSTDTDPQFALYWLWYAFDIGEVYFGRQNVTTIPNLSKSRLGELPIPHPSGDEQQKIATVLSAVQRAIEQQERLIALTAELKEALLDTISTSVSREQNSPEVGATQASQTIGTLGAFCEIKGGKRLPKGDRFAEGVTQFPYLRVTDFVDYGVAVPGLKYLREDTHRVISRYIITKGDIYLSIAGTIGVVGMVPDELHGANLTENAARIVLKGNLIEPRFLMFFLSSPVAQRYLTSQTVRNAQPKLALTRIKSLPVPIPPIEHQRECVQALDLLLSRAASARRTRDTLRALFRTLLHQLMTAQLRLGDLNVSAFDEAARQANGA